MRIKDQSKTVLSFIGESVEVIKSLKRRSSSVYNQSTYFDSTDFARCMSKYYGKYKKTFFFAFYDLILHFKRIDVEQMKMQKKNSVL